MNVNILNETKKEGNLLKSLRQVEYTFWLNKKHVWLVKEWKGDVSCGWD